MLEPLPATFASARDSLHALAEHVLAPARYRADGHLGLVPTVGGFGTPATEAGERVRVDGVELVHERPGTSTRVGLTTLGAAAEFVGVPLGAPADIYAPNTPCSPDLSIAVDPDAARALASWIAFAAGLLADLRERYPARSATSSTIWPEHFDLGMELGDAEAGSRANYGASPGDATIASPYLYVGPWDASRRTGTLAAYPFGAAITYDGLLAGDARATGSDFFGECAALLLGPP